MDLMAIAARLFLDRSEYEEGLSVAEASAQSFAGRLDEALRIAEVSADTAMTGIGRGFQSGAEVAVGSADAIAEGLASRFSRLSWESSDWGRDMMQNFISGISAMWGSLQSAVSGVAGLVRSYLGFSEPELGPLSDFHTYAPDMMALFAEGVRENRHLVESAVGDSFDLGPTVEALAPEAGVGREVESPRGGGSGRSLTVVMQVGRQEFARLVHELNDEETQRVGVVLSER